MRRSMRDAAWVGIVALTLGTTLGRRAQAEDAVPPPKDPPAMGEPSADDPAPDPPPDAAPVDRGLAVGTPAPAIEVPGWVNVAEGKAPTPETLKGRWIYIEFWATTCGPCVRTMPKVQSLHDRYAARGLVVLGLSPDPAYKQTEFAAERGLTFPLGIDSGDVVRAAYKVDGIPTAYLIDKEGRIAARTVPNRAEDAIDHLLGFHPGPTGPLEDYLAAIAAKDAPAARFHLERQVGRAVVAADLAKWATAAGGAPPAEVKTPPKVDGTKGLLALARARAAGDAAKVKPALDALAGGGPTTFDLSAWAAEVLARDYPVTAKELKDLADAKRWDALVDVVIDRRAPAAALDPVLKIPALQEFASKNTSRERGLARKGLMILLWPLADKLPKDEKANERFWRDLGSSGWVEDVKTKKPIAMDVEGTYVFKDSGPALVQRWLMRALVMQAFAAGKKPDTAKLKTDVPKAREAIEKELRAAYD
jgi:cytochrome c biogenesis protein CcmG/thiol:disulfide interchange protein DsbE